MSDTSYTTINLDEEGNLILPSDLLAKYGIIPGALVRLEQSLTGFSISRSSESLSRVYIEPTNICNLKCVTCMRNVWNEPFGMMSIETFENVLNGISKITPKPSVFFGGFGEPLTHPRIIAMIAAAKQVSSSVELITNGILLNGRMCSDLIKLGLDRLWVSIDGATPEGYADVRLGDLLPKVISNLEILQNKLMETMSVEPRLGVAFVAMKRNIQDLPDVIDLGKRLGADMFSISNVLPHSPDMVIDALYVGPHNGEVFASQWSPMLSLPRMVLNEYTTEPLSEAINKAGPITFIRKKVGIGADICPFVEKGSVSIRWDGAVTPCLALLHDNENYLDWRKRRSQAYSIDNINQNSLSDIWNTPSYISLRRRLLNFDFAFCTSCNGCDMADTNSEDCFGSPAPTCGGCLWAQGFIQCP